MVPHSWKSGGIAQLIGCVAGPPDWGEKAEFAGVFSAEEPGPGQVLSYGHSLLFTDPQLLARVAQGV